MTTRVATLRWTDDHCHLHHAGPSHVGHDGAPADEVAALVADAVAVGVERMITVGCDVADSLAAAELAAAHPGHLWATAGVHPHEARQGLDGLEPLLARPEVVAVGECGLDYHYDHSPRDRQREVFAAQVALAHAHDLPLVIHTREAWDDTFAVLAAEGVPRRTVFHCFTGGAPEARRCLDAGAVLSVSGIVTFRTADDVRAAVALAPLDRLMVETDSPFLAPVPHRGRPNLPGYLPLVGAGIAAAKDVGLDEVAAATWATASAFYALDPGKVTLTRTQAVALMEAHGLAPSRALGQNFVVDPNTVRRIARLAGVGPGDRVVEIGAGLGSLTLALAATGAAVTAVEVDRHLVPVLREVVAATGARVVEGDAMELDWTELLAGHDDWVLVANLPYNVATPLVLDLLDDVPAIGRMLVMVQREAGERLAADVGDAAYGIPSVKVRYWATARLAGKVGPDVFLPRPRVDSVLVEITRRAAPATDADHERLFTLVRAGFGQRRKMLRRSLAGLVAPEAFAAAGVRPEARAEELGVEDWGRLATAAPG